MLTGLLITFILVLLIAVSIGLVIVIAYWEMSPHIYEGYSASFPTHRFRSRPPRMGDLFEEESDKEDKKKSVRHIHYRE